MRVAFPWTWHAVPSPCPSPAQAGSCLLPPAWHTSQRGPGQHGGSSHIHTQPVPIPLPSPQAWHHPQSSPGHPSSACFPLSFASDLMGFAAEPALAEAYYSALQGYFLKIILQRYGSWKLHFVHICLPLAVCMPKGYHLASQLKQNFSNAYLGSSVTTVII